MSTPIDLTRIEGDSLSPSESRTSQPAKEAKLVSDQGLKGPLHRLIMSYLTHHGHAKTAQALQNQCDSINMTSGWTIENSSTDVDMDTASISIKRNTIQDIELRTHIVDAVIKGDMDLALQNTQDQFPSVLLADEGLMLFKLKCRKFIELLLETAEMKKRMDGLLASDGAQSEATRGRSAMTSAKRFEGGDLAIERNNDMDIDDESPSQTPLSTPFSRNGFSNGSSTHITHAASTRPARSSTDNEAVASYEAALTRALAYGQLLQKEYRKDKRDEVKNLFKRTFSAVAYEDPLSAGPEMLAIVGQDARVALSNELNQAVLRSQGRPIHPPLETLYRRAAASLLQLGLLGEGAAAFADIQKELIEI